MFSYPVGGQLFSKGRFVLVGLHRIGGCQKGRFPKGWFWRMLPRNENRNEGTSGCSPGTKTGTRVHPDVPPERKPERRYVRQNHPFTKPPFCLPVTEEGLGV